MSIQTGGMLEDVAFGNGQTAKVVFPLNVNAHQSSLSILSALECRYPHHIENAEYAGHQTGQ